MNLRDLVHLPIDEATRAAKLEGACVRVEMTAPPRGPIEGEARVVRAKCDADGTIVLTAAFYPVLHED